MDIDDMDVMSAEEFFGELEKGGTPAVGSRARDGKSRSRLFAELKVKMVMRIYGVSRARALEIIESRAAEKQRAEHAAEDAGARPSRRRRLREGEMMSAEEFFSED